MRDVDWAMWDWLPNAATEVERYVTRLLEEAGIKPHVVSARAKKISSFRTKLELKGYSDPLQEVTDAVAIRVITYSNTDRNRAAELVRKRFNVLPGEDRNPGDSKDPNRRGYDCQHIVIAGELGSVESDWLVAGGRLKQYFEQFGGLEVQIRTVAGHAWAEFEHARRYKGPQYQAVSEQDRAIIDQLLGAASDSRRALDETFVAIDQILARPSVDSRQAQLREELDSQDDREAQDEPSRTDDTPLDELSLQQFLERRYPDDGVGGERGNDFALALTQACGLNTVEALEEALEPVDGREVATLMGAETPVARVRRLDDELLARFGERYFDLTGSVGTITTRPDQLAWRFDRLRGKTRYKAYYLRGNDIPADVDPGPHTAARTLREVVRLVARMRGPEAVVVDGAVSTTDSLQPGARAKVVTIGPDTTVWVAANLNRESAESVMRAILEATPDLNIQVLRDETPVAGGPPLAAPPAG